MTNQQNGQEKFVIFSSRLMAAIRARETENINPLFIDPFAAQLAGDEAIKLLKEIEKNQSKSEQQYVPVRTKYFDNFLLSATQKISQVVILGSGMDTRAFRLSWPINTKIYEIDQRENLTRKAQFLAQNAPNCPLEYITADLTKSWANFLLERGFQPNLPSVWLLEGLIMYLQEAQANQLLKEIADLASIDSQIGLDMINIKALEYKPYKNYFQYGCDYPEDLFNNYGWKSLIIEPGDQEASFGRFYQDFSLDNVKNGQKVFFITAEKYR